MRISLKNSNRFVWRKWFAVYPVVIDGQLVWLETVERRYTTNINILPSEHIEYRHVQGKYATPKQIMC